MVPILEEDEVVGVFHQSPGVSRQRFGVRALPKTPCILQQKIEERFLSGQGRFFRVLAPDATNLPISVAQPNIERSLSFFEPGGKKLAGNVGIIGMDAILEANSGCEKILCTETEQRLDAIAHREHRQVLVERELDFYLHRGPSHALPTSMSGSRLAVNSSSSVEIQGT
ncbi:MAG: hypothetical protein WA802_16580 [Terracidiphilus sp.]